MNEIFQLEETTIKLLEWGWKEQLAHASDGRASFPYEVFSFLSSPYLCSCGQQQCLFFATCHQWPWHFINIQHLLTRSVISTKKLWMTFELNGNLSKRIAKIINIETQASWNTLMRLLKGKKQQFFGKSEQLQTTLALIKKSNGFVLLLLPLAWNLSFRFITAAF